LVVKYSEVPGTVASCETAQVAYIPLWMHTCVRIRLPVPVPGTCTRYLHKSDPKFCRHYYQVPGYQPSIYCCLLMFWESRVKTGTTW